MATLQQLRREAKSLGIPGAQIRLCQSSGQLQELIDSWNGKPRKKVAKKAVKKAVQRAKPVRKATKPKATPRKPTRKQAPAVKSQRGKAKRPVGDSAGRNEIGRVNFSRKGDWNPRPGSPPDTIIKALKRFNGDREKVFKFLLPDMWDYVGKVKRNGERRTKTEAQAMLKYRIARTLFDFVIKTNQHTKATNRADYGTAGTGDGTWKPARKRAMPKRKPGRPKGSTTKPKATTRPKRQATRGRRRSMTKK